MTPHAQTAQAIRQELKVKFPGTKFTVRSSSFSMGDDVSIGWLNGPTTREVEKITNKYQEGSFDGMQDMYEYNNSRDDIPQVKYVMTSREISEEIRENTAQEIAKKFGIADVEDDQAWFNVFRYYGAKRSEVFKVLADKAL
jgi:hypothetical protein